MTEQTTVQPYGGVVLTEGTGEVKVEVADGRGGTLADYGTVSADRFDIGFGWETSRGRRGLAISLDSAVEVVSTTIILDDDSSEESRGGAKG